MSVEGNQDSEQGNLLANSKIVYGGHYTDRRALLTKYENES